ncbi:MAG: hypothetical protein H6686_02820 [Fibrobacteria bacterium]|nr:hypothetical protein [Fibrobacteria bacterium]
MIAESLYALGDIKNAYPLYLHLSRQKIDPSKIPTSLKEKLKALGHSGKLRMHFQGPDAMIPLEESFFKDLENSPELFLFEQIHEMILISIKKAAGIALTQDTTTALELLNTLADTFFYKGAPVHHIRARVAIPGLDALRLKWNILLRQGLADSALEDILRRNPSWVGSPELFRALHQRYGIQEIRDSIDAAASDLHLDDAPSDQLGVRKQWVTHFFGRRFTLPSNPYQTLDLDKRTAARSIYSEGNLAVLYCSEEFPEEWRTAEELK